jgi:drug/metabolite transporter (DMT)-like permease
VTAPAWLVAPRSLLMTGLADVWTALREGKPPGESGRGGVTLMIASAALFALMAAFVKKYLPHTPTQAVVFSRGVMMAAVFVALARSAGAPIRGRRPGRLLLRGILGYLALSCYFFSVQHLPLGDAVLLQYSHPAFVAALAPLVLRERSGGAHWALVAAALAGIALIVRPTGDFHVAGLVGVFGSLLSALAYMTVRDLARTEHPITILVWFPLATIVPSFFAATAAGSASLPKNGTEVLGHLLVTVSALLGQVALTLGLTRVAAAKATAVTLTGPVFGLAFGWLMFGTVPDAFSLTGAGLVVGAVGLLGRATPAASPKEK